MLVPRQEPRSVWPASRAVVVREVGIAAGFILLAVVFFHRFVFGGLAPYWGDLLRYFYPIAYLATGSDARPFVFWNPYIFSGVPLAANPQTFTFYPFRAVFYFLPLDRAMVYLLVGHVAAVGMTTYVFLRRLRLAVASACFGGVVVMLSSYVISHFFHVTMTLAVAWTPLVLLSTDLMVRGGGLRLAGWGGLASGMQILAGHVQTWYFTLLLCVAYGLSLAACSPCRGNPRHWIRAIVLLAALAITALGVASIQLLPLIDIVSLLERPREAYAFATSYSLLPTGFVRLIAPLYYGAPQSDDYWGGWNYWELAGYVGIAPLLLALVGFAASRRVERYVFAGVMILGLLLAMGGSSPVYLIAYNIVPWLGVFRAPARFLLWFTVAVAALSSFGVDALLERGKSFKILHLIIWAGAGLLVVLFGLWWLAGGLHNTVGSFVSADWFVYWSGHGSSAIIQDRIGGARRSTEVAVLWTVASVVILSLAFVPRIPRRVVSGTITALTVLSLSCVGISFNLGVWPSTMLHPSQVATKLAHDAGFRFYLPDAYVKRLNHRYHSVSGFGRGPDYVEGLKASLFPNVNIFYGIQSIGGYDPLRNEMYSTILDDVRFQLEQHGTSALLDFLGGRYIISDRPFNRFAPRLSAPDGEANVYENPSAFPKFTVVSAYRVIRDSGETNRVLTSGTVNLRSTVLVNKDPFPGRQVSAEPLRSTVAVQEYSPDRVTAIVSLTRPGVLVMNDAFYAGWRAMVDGQRTEILRANAAFRAVPLLAGRHRVSFTYRPPYLSLGMGVSVLTFLVAMGLTVPGYWIKRLRE